MALLQGCGAQSSANNPGLAPTTQQSLAQAQQALNLERVALRVYEAYIPKIKDATARAAAVGADQQAQSLLTGYQADITNGNLAALQPDSANVTSVLEQLGLGAGLDALISALPDVTQPSP